jgi:hypothetical protein
MWGCRQNTHLRTEVAEGEGKARCAVWLAWLAIGSNAGGHFQEHDVPLTTIDVDGCIHMVDHYAWDVQDPTTIFKRLDHSIWREWEDVLSRTCNLWNRYSKAVSRRASAAKAAATRKAKKAATDTTKTGRVREPHR